MSGRFVRASKYRHVFGRSTRKEQCYDNLRISKNAWDTNLVKVNPKYISVNWEASGGGAFAVIPLNERGKLPERIPLFRGHTAPVLDTDWHPFNDSLICSSSDDGKILLWKVPENFTLYQEGEDVEDVTPVGKLAGHSRKVGHVLFNPSAENVLASAAGDYMIKLWDVESGDSKLSLKHADIVQSLSWSASGSQLVTTCRDKKLRVWDARQETAVIEVPGHSGAKNSRAVWMGDHQRIATTGFSRMSDRQLGLWDLRAPREPTNGFEILDQISGVCMPFWDDGTQCLYLAGKGDGNIRYYEFTNDKFEFLSQFSSPEPQRGVAFLPKRGVDTHENEVMRAYKTVADSYIEPVSFIVPRRAEVFQEDIYPPTVGTKPAMSATDWFAGKEGLPPKISLESLFKDETPEELPGDYKPEPSSIPASVEVTPSKAPPPTKTEPEPPKPVEVAAVKAPTQSIKDNQTAMETAAAKFADKEEVSSSDGETSSFEEVPKPVERSIPAAAIPKPVVANGDADKSISSKVEPIPAPVPEPVVQPRAASPPATAVHRSTPSASSATPGTAAEGLRAHLQDIKALIEVQNQTILAQSQKIDNLAREVEALKTRSAGAGSGDSAKDERIRMLELELEEARS